ncbi:expressed unknown protein [Seminavis robusta]|uniref:PsbP C-terminal domain-containing protein n=1 Tax=Seminavis robusta TaxID=568900 RepID=A0A9N8EH62_9STRA|nr:expressed unknown protein [Seminavis robusta]|eukprot:Sro996_g229340.1 n/a (227) ;mRNA; f:33590-34270
MKFLSVFLTLASLASLATAYTVPEPPKATTTTTRRDWLAATTTTLATTLAFGLPANAAEDLTTFNDPTHGFSIRVPSSWAKSEQTLNDRRTIAVWGDPNDAKTALFIAYTPVRDDFTSLQSFGAVDQVAAQTILPKSSLMMNDDSVQAEMIKAESKKQAYIFDYTQAVAKIQPLTHFRTIFTLQQGATGGAGAVLVTITLQTPEERYTSSLKPLFDQIIDSYGKNQ